MTDNARTAAPVDRLVRPFYERDGITIYCGSAWDVLPLIGVVDAVITDPPYGCKRPSQRTGKRADIQGNATVDTSWMSSLTVADGGAVYVFTSWEVIDEWKAAMKARWNLRSCIVWDKGIHGLADLKTCWAPRHELCLFAGVGRHELQGSRPIDVLQVQRTNDTDHPYEKPVALMRKLIVASGPSILVDPFMGSGSTLVAAKLEGKRAIGIDIEERYCEMAANRLRQGVFGF